jgi:formyl-CoA transferase
VLEFGTLIAGPFCSRILAEFGAEVIKIEAPGEGDPLRKWRKLYPTEDGDTSLWWFVQARNKQSVTLNLKHPRGVEIALQLAAQADIVVENFRPGVMEKLGLGWEVLSAQNPGLVMVRLSGFRSDRTDWRSNRVLVPSANPWGACATSPAFPTGRR